MRKRLISLIALLLVAASLNALVGCTRVSAAAERLTQGVTPSSNIQAVDIDERFIQVYTDFAAELFSRSFDGDNTAVSPLSMLLALGLVANGAVGETADEYTSLFGGISVDEMNRYLYSYVKGLEDEKARKLTAANSLWLNASPEYKVKREFLQSAVDWYAAEVFKGEFSDATADDVNRWCSENTDGMIEHFVDTLSPSTAALIVNALCFKSPWEDEYADYAVSEGEFTSQDGKVRNAVMLSSNEKVFLESSLATGFMKNYDGGRYAFIALLPNEGVSLSTLAASLDGDGIRELFATAKEDEEVSVRLPEFAYNFKLEMNKLLEDMGLEKALSAAADYSGFSSDTPFLLDTVMHMTHIELSREGTRAAAVSGIKLRAGAPNGKAVVLDRPFMYMIVDRECSLPVMLGAVTDIEA